ncbi:hypothetical protein N7491_011279 [Penicillium cf. griseofulvum]|uniref:Methyltransferase domain-containing protein n=1 Tax=Penicillium cf. griseofulvum TaxID=2972120 RepID=A0A9W9JS73_9EURO|nr:hypothetical protein N7472_004719 [Penicillium cf. griseofulvum]KAJ5416377.1 hypothetical protein N7491_011279 [Penicillium cf. griseofulvum]KAJ5442287.1 hypothetical protein N7445_005294 [Penicillium cf. griseofulvum]
MSDFTEANRKYFDNLSATYKERFGDSLKMLSAQTLQRRHWINDRWTDTEAGRGQKIKLLEYACGPGVISMTLAPFVTEVIGVDISDKMVAEFNQSANTLGLADKVIGYKADLLTEHAPAEAIDSACTNLDVLTISMALHHFEHPDRALKSLGQRLKKDGVCFIIDLVPRDGHLGPEHEHNHGHSHEHSHEHGHGIEDEFPEAAHTVKTHGFSCEDMQQLFQGSGFNAGFDYQVVPEPLKITIGGGTLSKTVFMARAQRA